MPLYRDPQSRYWYVRFTVGGVKVRRSSGTTDRLAAEEFEAIIYMTNPPNGACPSVPDGYPSGMAKAKKSGKPPRSLGERKKPVPFRDVVQKLLETEPARALNKRGK